MHNVFKLLFTPAICGFADVRSVSGYCTICNRIEREELPGIDVIIKYDTVTYSLIYMENTKNCSRNWWYEYPSGLTNNIGENINKAHSTKTS